MLGSPATSQKGKNQQLTTKRRAEKQSFDKGKKARENLLISSPVSKCWPGDYLSFSLGIV